MIEIKRLVDGALLPTFQQTKMQVNPDAFGSSRSQASTIGAFGETIPLGSSLNPRDFTISWISSDTTGFEQHQLRKFFGSGEPYSITVTELGLQEVWGTVVEREPGGWKSTTIVFSSRFGSPDVKREVLASSEWSFAAGAKPLNSYALSLANTSSVPAVIQVTFEATEVSSWRAGTTFMVNENAGTRVMDFTIGVLDDFGAWSQPQRRKSIAIDSTRVLLGGGYFDPVDAKFFRVMPGQTYNGTLTGLGPTTYTAPVPGAWKLRVELVAYREEL